MYLCYLIWQDSESKRSVNYIVCIVENIILGGGEERRRGEIHDLTENDKNYQ